MIPKLSVLIKLVPNSYHFWLHWPHFLPLVSDQWWWAWVSSSVNILRRNPSPITSKHLRISSRATTLHSFKWLGSWRYTVFTKTFYNCGTWRTIRCADVWRIFMSAVIWFTAGQWFYFISTEDHCSGGLRYSSDHWRHDTLWIDVEFYTECSKFRQDGLTEDATLAYGWLKTTKPGSFVGDHLCWKKAELAKFN